ncbi:Abscisic acid G-protein coupled receptor-domain-containing protein [Fomitopsis serialis]|uniref:Abscisic acid G-protein coupled receptor-domain-containing protein n=1 Tax=Fomitopsis serialis TaxID=139415 RepID=UPI00200881BA|nr:Abscisic acid G-protein coupled receptor-domain-containing protein [Neoantrodia serialis]KAH9929419.1 Abscisic acid G-protein coupled receptor-domain-containing protein [Neoantrodia serialis]
MIVLTLKSFLETGVLFTSRLCLFLACRKYLLRHLYHDLQDLSAQRTTDPGTPPVAEADNIELETLPEPSTATVKRASSLVGQRPFHSVLARSLFALCFSESCTLFLLLMCQAFDVLDPRARLLNWNISLSLLLAAILVLIPLSYSLVVSDSVTGAGLRSRQRPSVFRILLNFIPVGLFLFLLAMIPLPSALPTSGIIVTTLSQLTVLGTIILGLLSGFGAINTAWIYFPRIYGKQSSHPSDEDIRMAEQGLQRVQSDLALRRQDVQKLQAAQQQASPDTGWFSRMATNFRGDSQLSSTLQELSGLESLEYEMSRNLETLKERQADAKFSRTIGGMIFNWGGRLFAVYCIFRILNSLVNLVIPAPQATSPAQSSRSVDMLSIGLAKLLSLLPSVHIEEDGVADISRQISLGLVGVIILSSIRLVLRGVARALRVTSRNLGASLMLLILAQLMGIYLLSTLVQLRTSFPPPPLRPDVTPDVGLVNLFSTLPEYQLFGSLFDGSFLVAAAGGAVVRWFGDRIRNADMD